MGKEYLDKYMKAFTGMPVPWQPLADYLRELLSPYGLCTSKAVKLTKQKGGKIYSGADKRLKYPQWHRCDVSTE